MYVRGDKATQRPVCMTDAVHHDPDSKAPSAPMLGTRPITTTTGTTSPRGTCNPL